MSQTKILVVEDERITAEDLKDTLENLGYEVTGLASSADTFYQSMQTHLPDLVLMDIYLKGNKDGIELATETREKYQLPVIYLTAYSDTQILERAKLTTPFGYILKPFQDRELHSNIEMALYKNRMEKRILHLNTILKAIREINQLIVSVHNPKELLLKTCETLTSGSAYKNAWFLFTDAEGAYLDSACAGISDKFESFVSLYQDGFRPNCISYLNNKKQTLYTKDSSQNCEDCPIYNLHPGLGTIISKVRYQNRQYGFLAASILPDLVNDKEEQALFAEISDDLGLALNNLEKSKKQQEAEAALQKSETLFRHAFDYAATSMCIIGMDGKFRRTNTAFLKLLEYQDDELKQMHFNDITHPDDLKIGIDMMKRMSDGDMDTVSYEKRYLSKSRQTVWVFISISLVRNNINEPDFFIAQFIDLTDRKLAEENLRDSEEQYRTFMNSCSDLAFLKDDQLCYMMINNKQQEFFNKSAGEILGKTDFDLMPPANAERCNTSDLKILESMQINVTLEMWGDKIYESHKFPVRLKNGNFGVGAFIREVTEQIHIEEAVRDKTRELERFNNLMVDRELRMIELKKEINELLVSMEKEEKYKIVSSE